MRILIVEPYYGGSHRTFIKGLTRSVDADFVLLTLPARSWKQRMQLAALWAVDAIKAMEDCYFDTVLCSTFIDVALLKSMAQDFKGWNPRARFCTYFHENQFAYPTQFKDTGVWQFRYLNFTTALASDSIAFNSEFNRTTFLNGCRQYLQKTNLISANETIQQLTEKSRVLHPGIDWADNVEVEKRSDQPPVIVWNHRWEHDKGPEEFFESLLSLDGQGVDFSLLILGQQFTHVPECFEIARRRLAHRIVHYGFVEDREKYFQLLKGAGIVVSTARHEFFGLSVLEAVAAGCVPLLPRRLSYPELFPEQFLYDEGELTERLANLCAKGVRLKEVPAVQFALKYSWQNLRADYSAWLAG